MIKAFIKIKQYIEEIKMKKKLLLVIGLLFVFIAFFNLSFSRSYKHALCKSTDLSKENINGIYLGDSINNENVKSKYGNINKLSQDNEKYNYYYLNEQIEIATEKDDNKIKRFVVNDKNIETHKNIKINNHKDKIIKVYGKNYYKRVEQGTDIIGYVDKKNNISIEFWMVEDKVRFFRLDYDYME